MKLDVELLHKAFFNSNEKGQTTLMFDSILRLIELKLDELPIYVVAKDMKHAHTLCEDFNLFLKDYYQIPPYSLILGRRIENGYEAFSRLFRNKILFHGKEEYKKKLRGIGEHHLFIDNCIDGDDLLLN